VQEGLFCFFVILGQVQHDHAGEEVGPQEGFVWKLLIRIEEDYFFSVFSLHIVSGHVDVRFGVFAEKTAYRFFFLAYQIIDKETFANLFGSHKGYNIEVRVVLVSCKVIN
jgi:hypothetical protein